MARLITYDDAAAFRAGVEPFLLADEPRNNLLFGIMRGIERGTYPDALLTSLESGGEVVAAALRTPPHPLVLAMATHDATRALADALADQDLSGVNGDAAQAQVFAETWAARTGVAVRRAMSLGVYALTAVRPPPIVAGRARTIDARDRDLALAWLLDFEREALPADDPAQGRAVARVDLALEDAEAPLLLWEVDGTPVSLAGYGGPTPSGMRVGPVYTPPEQRRRGYAAALVADLSARLLAQGRTFCFLYTDLANPTSNGVYRRIGYEQVGEAAMYRFGGG